MSFNVAIYSLGKSSVLNAMRRTYTKKGNIKRSVQPHAGATRSVQERVKLLDNPLTFCYDTPGICQPVADDVGKLKFVGSCVRTNCIFAYCCCSTRRGYGGDWKLQHFWVRLRLDLIFLTFHRQLQCVWLF